MSRDDLHFRLRIPEDLKKKIEDAAAISRRSMTAEIVSRLEQSFLSAAGEQSSAERWEIPEGVSEDDIASAINEVSRNVISTALRSLGIEQKPLLDEKKKLGMKKK